MRTINEIDIVRGLKKEEAALYVGENLFTLWNAWFWLLLDGGGGVGKTTIKESFEPKAIGISNGDFFRSLNKLLTEMGCSEAAPDKIYTKLPFISVTTQMIDGKKRIVASYGDNAPQMYDPKSPAKDGLRNTRREFTDWLSANSLVVTWWRQQIKNTLNYALEEGIPVVHEGRTNRDFRQKTERPMWDEYLQHAVIGYLYISRLELAQRSESRARKQYPRTDQSIPLEVYVQKAVADDWERTVLEMSRSEERLLRPSEAVRSDQSRYDFAFNISNLNPIEAKSLIAAALMANLDKNSRHHAFYNAIFESLAEKLEVNLDSDPQIPQIEDDIDATVEELIQKGKLEPQILAS